MRYKVQAIICITKRFNASDVQILPITTDHVSRLLIIVYSKLAWKPEKLSQKYCYWFFICHY